jgi:hypothetical protein
MGYPVYPALFMSVSAAIADPLLSHVKREAQDGKSLSVSLHARYELRFTRNALSGGVAMNRHE